MGTLTLQTIKCMMDGRGFYNAMNIDPIAYHGYRETVGNLRDVIEEIDVEILLRPEFSDKLLDFRFDLDSRLKVLELDKFRNTPCVASYVSL